MPQIKTQHIDSAWKSPAVIRVATITTLRPVDVARKAASAKRAKVISDVSAELSAAMGAALSGIVNKVPDHYTTKSDEAGKRPIEGMQHTMDAVLLTLDHITAGAKLRALLEKSECPYARELRAALIAGYAQMNAEDIASARGLI
jgi:hypothetical protein